MNQQIEYVPHVSTYKYCQTPGKKLSIRTFEPPEELRMKFECFLHYHHSLASDNNMAEILTELSSLFK